VLSLDVVWTCSYRSHALIQGIGLSRRSYIGSNISFSIPVLLPWLLLSAVVDLIYLLPFDFLKHLLATTAGQTGYFLFFLLMVAIFGPMLIQQFWGCKPLSRGIHRTLIEASCARAGVAYAEILSWPIFGGRMITAGVMGLVKRFRYILVTPALLRFLDLKELDAVILHEIGHIKRRHLFFYLLFFMSLVWTILHSQIILGLGFKAALLYSDSLYWIVSSLGNRWFFSNFTLEAFFFIALFFLYFRFIFGYFMRNFERQADIFVYEFQDNAGPLISSLKKIVTISGQPPEKPNWHHFSIRERIDYLRRCDADRSWVGRHHRKIRNSILVYLVFIFLINSVGLELKSEETREKVSDYLVGSKIVREMQNSPENSAAFQQAGDYYYISKKDYQKAVEAYARAISLDPDNLHALNNLSWLLATCEDEAYRDPERALAISLEAVALEEAPYILDTLAESYYVNGMLEEAVRAERRALSLASREERMIFEKQLRKFEDAAGELR